MKLQAPALLLLLPLLANAAQPDWLDATGRTEEEILQQMQQGRTEVDGVIATLGRRHVAPIPENRDESLPALRKGYAVAVADGGLLFDSGNSRVTYLGNVRVNEERMQMRCRNRLYIQLPPSDVKKSEEELLEPAEAAATPARSTAKQPPAPTAGLTPPKPAVSTPSPTAVATTPATQQAPLEVRAYDVMVDGVGNNILLRSNGTEGIPYLKRGNDELLLGAGAEETHVLADAQGNIHVSSGRIELKWVDEQERPGTLVSEQGRMVFNRGTHELYIPGVSHFHAPDGTTMDCEEAVCVTLLPDPAAQEPKKGGFLSQFTTLRYSGVEKAVATGNVCAKRPATETTPHAMVQGETCTYDGRSGACAISGPACRLTYGAQEIETRGSRGSITLSPEGDIRLLGENGLGGVYELPARDGGKAQRGTFETDGEAVFTAADGQVHFPRGMRAHDEINRFSCTGALVLQLKPGTGAPPERKASGMLNLAIAAYSDISTMHATGEVDMHYADPHKKIPADVRGDDAFFDLDKGTAHVTAIPGQECAMAYGSYNITARSEQGASTASVDEQGNIDVRGEAVRAVLPDRGSTAQLDTTTFLHLTRETRELEVGPGSRLNAPDGILTAKDVLYVTLTPAEGAQTTKPTMPRYPHLSYNFGEVESARTARGGTLQTAKASMQCTGPIRMTFVPASAGKTDTISRLRATAEGNVAILGKESSGRLIRATGDHMTVNGNNKILTGACVTLADEKNTHIATGKGARVTVDEHNNARINGEKQVTHATGIRGQANTNDSTQKKD